MNEKIFFTFQNGDLKVNVVIELYSSKWPNTTKNFLDNCISSEQNYKFSQLTRIISPEFIIQGGNIVRQSQILDLKEYHLDRSLLAHPGKLLIVSNPNNPDEWKSSEFFITLANLSSFKELENYMVIGEVISEIQELVQWGQSVKVNEEGIPSKDVIISRCGQVVKKQQHRGDTEHRERSRDNSSHHHRHSSHDSRRRHEDADKDRSYRSSRSYKSHHSSSSKHKESDTHSRSKRYDGYHHHKRSRSREAR